MFSLCLFKDPSVESIHSHSSIEAKQTDELQLCDRILNEMLLSEHSRLFKTINNCNIKNPMDFTAIQEKLVKKKYKSALELSADVRLIITNCLQYYPIEHEMTKMSRKLIQLFDEIYYNNMSDESKYTEGITATTSEAVNCELVDDFQNENAEKTDDSRSEPTISSAASVINNEPDDNMAGTSVMDDDMGDEPDQTTQEKSTSTKIHICQICNVGFTSKYNLKRHVLSQHESIKRYGCDFCDKNFAQKANMLRHEILVHGAESTSESE